MFFTDFTVCPDMLIARGKNQELEPLHNTDKEVRE